MRALIIMALSGVTACATPPAPVSRPCGVITDDLKGVKATTTDGQQRLGIHRVRGIAANCWTA